MFDIDVLVASNMWWKERKSKGAHHYIIRVMPTLFGTLHLLYAETKKLPLNVLSGAPSVPEIISISNTSKFGLNANSNEYAKFRTILSLTGDVYELLKPIKDLTSVELQELYPYVNTLYNEARKFSGLRNVFTHLGEVVTDMKRHGVSGPMKTKCNIEYATSAKDCVHLIYDSAGQTFHYVYQKKAEDVSFSKNAFTGIFDLGRGMYSELINYKGASGHPPASILFHL